MREKAWLVKKANSEATKAIRQEHKMDLRIRKLEADKLKALKQIAQAKHLGSKILSLRTEKSRWQSEIARIKV